jgi:alcohol dehydrogenase
MRAAILERYGEPLVIRDVDPPGPDAEGVVVRAEACGICRSDWHAWQGHGEWADDQVPLGHVLGHEPAGTVVEVGERVETLRAGDRVAIPFNLGDGTCPQCRRGRGNLCANDTALGFHEDAPGAFAEQVHVPHADHNAVPLPEGVSTTEAAVLGCRFVTAFHALAHRAEVTGGDWVAVHGCGGLGLSAVHVADALGGTVVAVDLDDDALSLATDLGAVETIRADETDDVPRAVRDQTDGGADVSVDALGIAETCRNSVASLGPRGRHVQVGLTTDKERGEVPLPTDVMVGNEITFLGSRGMPPSRYDELFEMIERGHLEPARLVTREVVLSDVSDRLAAMTDFGTVGVEVVTSF